MVQDYSAVCVLEVCSRTIVTYYYHILKTILNFFCNVVVCSYIYRLKVGTYIHFEKDDFI